jgi:hypothetical protein
MKYYLAGKPMSQYSYSKNYELVHDIKRRLQECHKVARANLVQSKQHRVAQQASKVNISKFSVGDKVLLRNDKAGKLDCIWSDPFVIVETDSKLPNVLIELTRNRRTKVHVNRGIALKINSTECRKPILHQQHVITCGVTWSCLFREGIMNEAVVCFAYSSRVLVA